MAPFRDYRNVKGTICDTMFLAGYNVGLMSWSDSGAERLPVYMRRRIPQMNGTTKRILVGFTALLLAPLAALEAGAAVKVAVAPNWPA